MAPLRVLPRHRYKRSTGPLQTGASLKRLVRLRILVYILLVTSAIFGLAVLLWKFGYFLRFFTLGRILRDRKPVDTRYIKTWYGWIPQDRYNSRRQAWKNWRSVFRRWFSWSDSDDYSLIWWDSRLADIPTGQKPNANPPEFDKTGSSLAEPIKSVTAPARVENDALIDPNSYYLQPRASTYLTFPFCLKPGTIHCYKAPLRPISRLSIACPAPYNHRRLNRLREWTARLQMGSLQSILPHQSGLLGRPGSPASDVYSSSSSSSVQESCENARSKNKHDGRCNILEVEIRFLDKLDRNLEWLLNECQAGNRGFKFATLQSKLKWLIYTNPCCASTEVMRRYGDRRTTVDLFEGIDSRRRRSATVNHRRPNLTSVNSWRAAINEARRRQTEAPQLRSFKLYESSADDVAESALDPANWMLPRPPQGFGMPTSQRNAYYYGGIGNWAKLEDWQAADGCYNDISKGVSVFAAAKTDYYSQYQHGISICS